MPFMSLVRCDVEAIFEKGIAVKVWDFGIEAFIPANEAFASSGEIAFVWNKLSNGKERLGVNDRLLAWSEAALNQSTLSRPWILSRRKAIAYQYAEIKVGDVVPLTITELSSSFVFGRVRGGVRAKADLSTTEHALRNISRFHNLEALDHPVNLHDTIAGIVVEKSESEDPVLTIDVSNYLRSVDLQDAPIHSWRLHSQSPDSSKVSLNSRPSTIKAKDTSPVLPAGPIVNISAPRTRYSKVLIVDDDKSVLSALVEFFSAGGYETDAKTDLAAATAALRADDTIDLLMVDLHWPTTNAVSWADRLFSEVRALDCILMTTLLDQEADPLIGDLRLSGALGIAKHGKRFKDLWNKTGFDLENGLVTILNRMNAPDETHPVQENLLSGFLSQRHARNSTRRVVNEQYTQLQGCIDKTMEELPDGAKLVLFSLTWSTFEVRMHASSGNLRRAFEHIHRHLHKSPIRDLLVDREVRDDPDVLRREAKYRWLLKLVPFDWIYAREVPSHENDLLYGLFLFGSKPEHLNSWSRIKVRLCASEMELVLMQQCFEGKLLISEQMASFGAAHQKMAHEVKAKTKYIAAVATRILSKEDPNTNTADAWNCLLNLSRECSEIANELLPDKDLGTPEPLHIDKALKSIVQQHQQEHSATWARLRLGYVTPNMPDLRIRPIVLSSIVGNLISNAADFLELTDRPQGEIVLEAILNLGHHPPCVDIWCHDAACGISRSLTPRIFEPRFSTKQHGTGYGLAICRDLATQYGGSIELAETVLGVGSSFVLRLPLAKDSSK